MPIDSYTLHESAVTGVVRTPEGIAWQLIEPGSARAFRIIACRPRQILRDEVPFDGELMEATDGELLWLNLSEDGMELGIEWADFAAQRIWTRHYRIRCERVLVKDGVMDAYGSQL